MEKKDYVFWDVRVPARLDEAVKRKTEECGYASKSEFLREAARNELRKKHGEK